MTPARARVSHAVFCHYFRDDEEPGDDTDVINSQRALDEFLDYAVAHEQPFTPSLVVREQALGVHISRRLIRFAVDTAGRVGAMVYLDAEQALMSLAQPPMRPIVPRLYVDRTTLEQFPRDAVLPWSRVRAALGEFRQTGELPTCVAWQPTDATW